MLSTRIFIVIILFFINDVIFWHIKVHNEMIMIGWHISSNYFTIYKWIICVPVRVCTNDC